MVAKSDPGRYGQLEAYVMPAGQAVEGPVQIAQEMQSDPTVSAQQSLLSRGGSTVKLGNVLMLPISDSIIAVRPMYVQAAGANNFPQLRKVIVWHAGQVRMGNTLQEGLRLLFGDAPVAPVEGEPAPGPSSATVAALLAKADEAFEAADNALREGDLAGYQRHNAEAREYVRQAQDADNREQTAKNSASA